MTIDPYSPEAPSPAVGDELATSPDAAVEALPFVAARHFAEGREVAVELVVIHTSENDCAPGVALAVAHYFAGPGAPEASSHYVVGPELVVQCVHEEDTAWHAPGANAWGIGIEHTARASFTAETWELDAVEAMLSRSAALVAAICRRHGIPVVRLDAEQLRAGAAGICGHVDVSRAFRKSDHFDPGPSFPWDRYLELVRAS